MPDTDSDEHSEKPPPLSPPRKRGRSCLVVLAVLFFLGLVLVAALTTGPGFRAVATFAAHKALASQGIAGDLAVTGNLWTGIGIEGLDLSSEGDGSPRLLASLDRARVDYRLGELIRRPGEFRWLEVVAAENLDLELVLPESAGKDKNKEPEEKSARERDGDQPSPLWNLLASDIALRNLTARITVGEASYAVEGLNLESAPGEERGFLSWEGLSLPGTADKTRGELPLEKNERQLSVGPYPFSNRHALRFLRLSEPDPGDFLLSMELDLDGSVIRFDFATAGQATLQMTEGGPLDLGKLAGDISVDAPPFDGRLESLSLTILGDFSRPGSLRGDGGLALSGLGLEKRALLDRAELNLEGTSLNLEATRGDERLAAKIDAFLHENPSQGVLGPPHLLVNADLSLPDLATTLANLAPGTDLPLGGALRGEIANLRVHFPREEAATDAESPFPELYSGSISLSTERFTWEGQPLRDLGLTASFPRANHAKLQLSAGLDDITGLDAEADFDLEKLRYSGEGTFDADTGDRLGTVLAHFDAADYAAGRARLLWNGEGRFGGDSAGNGSPVHEGTLSLSLEDTTISDASPFDGNIELAYRDDSLAIPVLSLRSGNHSIHAEADWDGRRLHLEKFSVADEFRERLRLSGEIPLDPGAFGRGNGEADGKGKKVGFLDQPGPVNLSLEADGMSLSSVSRFFLAEIPIDGRLDGELSSKGRLRELETSADLAFVPVESGAKKEGGSSNPPLAVPGKEGGLPVAGPEEDGEEGALADPESPGEEDTEDDPEDRKGKSPRAGGLLDGGEAEARRVSRPGGGGESKGSGKRKRVAGDPEAQALPSEPRFALQLSHRGDFTRPASWDLDLDTRISGLSWKDTPLEMLRLVARTEPGGEDGSKRAVARLSARQSTATLAATAALALDRADSIAELTGESVELDAALRVEQLARVMEDFAPAAQESFPLAGRVEADLNGFALRSGKLVRGKAEISADELSLGGTATQPLRAEASVTAPQQLEGRLSLPFDEHSTLSAEGGAHLDRGDYSGKLALEADLHTPGALRELVAARNLASLLPADSTLDWRGHGNWKEPAHRGEFSFEADGLRLAEEASPLSASLSGKYTENSLVLRELQVRSEVLDLDGSLEWADKILHVPSLTGLHQGRKVIDLSATLPLDPGKLGAEAWFAQEENLDLDLEIRALPLADITRLVTADPPVRGALDADLAASGTPRAPVLDGWIELGDLALDLDQEQPLALGGLELVFSGKQGQASLSGAYDHPELNPLQIDADLPFHPGAWATGQRAIASEEFSASARMERTPLGILPEYAPAIGSIDGTLALDLAAAGSFGKPDLSGKAELDVPSLRFGSRHVPTFRNLAGTIRFEDRVLHVDRLAALVAGGPLEIQGLARFPVAGPPTQLDLTAKGSEVLLARNPDFTLRSNVDLAVTGPWEAARISGSLGITGSRYFKNIELNPSGLFASRAQSALPTVERAPAGGGPASADLDFGVEAEPFRDWTVDLRLHTADPFLVRGNLARSAIETDIHLSNTLGRPVPRGFVEIAEGRVSLPFSSIDVETGKVVFNQRTGFNGNIEFKANAKAGDHLINIYVHDQILSPKHVLTSVPPLPAEDIMTLLATGETRDELLGGDGSMAASKAAGLFLKNLNKSRNEADKPPSLLDKLRDRTELELGKENPETGTQTFGGKIRLWKKLFFVADIDAESDYRALLKYVFQFQ